MTGRFQKFRLVKPMIVALISVTILVVGCSISTSIPTAPSTTSFSYFVHVQNAGEDISTAKVKIQVAGKAPLDAVTDSEGIARIFIDSTYAGQPGNLIVEATGYKEYTKNIDLVEGALPDVIQLEPELTSISQNNSTPTATPTIIPVTTVPPTVPLTENPPPEILGFTLLPPGPLLINEEIGIQANIKRNGHTIDDFWWEAEQGSIVSDQGESFIRYQAPGIAGSYKVGVQIDYQGGVVKDATAVKVVEPTPTQTPTLLPTPTQLPTPTIASTPTYPFANGPELYHPKQYVSYTIGDIVPFEWEEFSLSDAQYYSIRVCLRDRPEKESCIHRQFKVPKVDLKLDCPQGLYKWSVGVATKLSESPNQECPPDRYNDGWCTDTMVNYEHEFGLGEEHPDKPRDGNSSDNTNPDVDIEPPGE